MDRIKESGFDVVSGEVFAVLSDDDIIDYEDGHVGEGLIYRRTTERELYAPIRTSFTIETT